MAPIEKPTLRRNAEKLSLRQESALPAAAESVIELDHADEFGTAYLLQRQLGGKQIAVSIKRVELGIDAAYVTTVSQSFADLQRDYQFLLLDAALARSLVRDQRVGNLLESRVDRFFVSDLRILALGLGQPHSVLQPSGGEDGLRQLGHVAPRRVRAGEKLG
jgi:hypothetical protein